MMDVTAGFLSFVQSFNPPAWATITAGFFMIITLCLSLYLVFEHLLAYKNPEEQKFLIGVVLMVPCYSIESYVSLLNPSVSVYCGILRDFYEAFAMYCFGRYFVACLGGEERAIEFMKREGASVTKESLLEHSSGKGILHHHFPMDYLLEPWIINEEFYHLIKFGIFQYMIIKTITALLSMILEAFGSYCDGELFRLECGYPYMTVVLNFSQYWALYCLVQFYSSIKDELAHLNPLAKFLVFKSIVFLTWWQGVIIAALYTLGLLRSPIAQSLQFKSSIQDFIICIEMFVASVVHLYVFPSKPYELMGDLIPKNIKPLGDYVSVDWPVDPEEIRDMERPTKLRIPQPEVSSKVSTDIRDSVRDIVIGGGEYMIKDLKFTVGQAAKLSNQKLKGISKKNKSKDDSFIAPASTGIAGISELILDKTHTDTERSKGRKHRRASSYAKAESEGEYSDKGGGYVIGGNRWITND